MRELGVGASVGEARRVRAGSERGAAKGCLALAALWLFSVPALAVPFTSAMYLPTRDAFVLANYPDRNVGSGGANAVSGSASTNYLGTPMGVMDTFMAFNMAGLVASMDAHFGTHDWAIQSVVLRLSEQSNPNNQLYNQGQGHFEVRWIANDSWPEGSGTANVPPPIGHVCFSDEGTYLNAGTDLALGTFANHGPLPEGNARYDLLLSLSLPVAFVQDVRAGGDVSFFLDATDSTIGLQFASRTNNTPATRPWIQVTADVVPEPATACLLAVGLIALARGRRKRP